MDLGPQARVDLRDELHEQVRKSVAAGARVLLGGEVPQGPGAFYPPTVLTAVGPGMPAYDEELFGPVAAVIAARDEAEAVRIANDSVFGLGAAVFTRDRARGERLAAEDAGGRLLLRERSREVRSAAALRRDQAIGLRARALALRDPRVREHQDRLRQVA